MCRQRTTRARSSCFLVLAALVVCSPGAAGADHFVQPEQGSPFTLGDGLESYSGNRRASCLADVRPATNPNNGQVVSMSLSRTENLLQLTEQLGVSISARFNTGAWRGSASAGWMRASNFTSRTRTFVARVSVRNSVQAINNSSLNESAREALSNTHDPAAFRRQCGDQYVSSVTTGGEFYAIMTYEFSSDAEANSFASSATIGSDVSRARVSAMVETARRSATQSYSFRAEFIRRGATGALPSPNDEAAVLDYLLNFPTLVQSGASPALVSFTTETYPVGNPSARGASLAAIAMAQDRAQERLTAIQAIQAEPDQYAFPVDPGSGRSRAVDLEALDVLRGRLVNQILELNTLAENCMNFERACGPAGTVPSPLSVRTPRRLNHDIGDATPRTGGCVQWTPDGQRCLRCRFEATEGLALAENTSGFRTTCEAMPVGQSAMVTATMSNLGSNPAGHGPTQLLQATLQLHAYETGCSGGACQFQDVRANSYPNVSLTAQAVVRSSGSVPVAIHGLRCFNNVNHHCALMLGGLVVEIRVDPSP